MTDDTDDSRLDASSKSKSLPTRVRGLLLFVGGVGLTPVAFYVAEHWLGLGEQSHGRAPVGPGLIIATVLMAWVGWVELLSGVSIDGLGEAFQKSTLRVSFVVFVSPIVAIYALMRLARALGWL